MPFVISVCSLEKALGCFSFVAGFAFLTAFGLTRIFKGQKDGSNKNFFRIVVKRLAKLELIVIIVYRYISAKTSQQAGRTGTHKRGRESQARRCNKMRRVYMY